MGRRRNVNARWDVLKALIKHHRLTWRELLNLVEISKGGLSLALNKLISDGLVATEVITTRPPKTLYSIRPGARCPICGGVMTNPDPAPP